MKRVDVLIVGAGIAGASLAAELAPHASVLVIEAEAQPGHHSTGRSAAFWAESYGGPGIQPLTTASEAMLRKPPADFSDEGFLRPRGALHLADAGSFDALDAFAASFAGTAVQLDPVDEDTIRSIVPGLRAGPWRALLEPTTADIEVAALHAAYLRAAKRSGAGLAGSAPLRSARHEGGRWIVEAGDEPIMADILVDAAGAWADTVAALSGVTPLGIRPYRRTVAQVRIGCTVDEAMPLVMDAAERFYFKPVPGGRLWLSPHDEIPDIARDAAPEEIDVATAIDRMEGVVDWPIERVEHSWAGLRSFAPDRLPVYGFDAGMPGFFWFAGQGGFGIQTAPAAARIAAALVTGRIPDESVRGIDLQRYAASRF